MTTKKFVFDFVLILTFCSLCFGDQQNERMEQADIYFQAGDYDRAIQVYENLMDSEKEAWKKSILEFNIATATMEKGDLEEAVKKFSGISLGKGTFPLLIVNVRTNVAIARWRIAKKIVSNMVAGGAYYEEDYLKAVFILNQALIDVKRASHAHCDQLIDEGDNLCVPSYTLNKLRDALQQQLAVVEVEHLKRSLKSMTPKYGVPLILEGLNAIKQEIVELLSISMPQGTKIEQDNRIFEQAITWERVWNTLDDRVDDNNLFLEAKESFYTFIHSLSEGNLQNSLSAIKNSIRLLNEYMGILYDHDSVVEFLEKLLVSYEKAELMVPLQEAHLVSINDQQKTIMEILSKKNVNLSMLEEASSYLDTAVENAKIGKFKNARVYLTTAYQLVKRFKWTIQIDDSPTVEEFLEHLISEQMASIVVNYAIIQVDADEKVKESGLENQAQEITLNLASNFWRFAIKQQKEDFNKPLVEGEENSHRCQYHPWAEVIELFDKGYQEAQDAMNIMKGEYDKHPSIIHQDTAMRYWREALETLKNPPQQESCYVPQKAPQSNEQQQQEQDSQPKQQQQEQQTPINEVLRLLQKMEQDDRQKKEKTGKVRILEDKAW